MEKHEAEKHVAYLGPEATYTHQATLLAFPPSHYSLLPLPTISSVFKAVASSSVSIGVVPLSNSTNGYVLPTLDALSSSSSLTISRALHLSVQHSLLSLPSTKLSDIRSLHSHPQAWTQCTVFLERNLPKAERVDEDSTSAAARGVASSSPEEGRAAIASPLAAEMFGLSEISGGIQDADDNTTRFVVLSTGDVVALEGEGRALVRFRTNGESWKEVMEGRGLGMVQVQRRPSGWVFVEMKVPEASVEELGAVLEELRKAVLELVVCGMWQEKP